MGFSSSNIAPLISSVFPHPLRFKEEWRQTTHGGFGAMAGQAKSGPLFVWKAVPPGPAFVALGMVVAAYCCILGSCYMTSFAGGDERGEASAHRVHAVCAAEVDGPEQHQTASRVEQQGSWGTQR
jgi:hypothetical protein